MLKRVDGNLIDTKREDDAGWFFMEWCNRPDFESFRNKENNKVMKDVIWNLQNGIYDMEKFENAIMNTRRFKLEYEEFEDMVESKRELVNLKIQDIIENENF